MLNIIPRFRTRTCVRNLTTNKGTKEMGFSQLDEEEELNTAYEKALSLDSAYVNP